MAKAKVKTALQPKITWSSFLFIRLIFYLN